MVTLEVIVKATAKEGNPHSEEYYVVDVHLVLSFYIPKNFLTCPSGPRILSGYKKKGTQCERGVVDHAFLTTIEIMGAWPMLKGMKLMTQSFFLVCCWSLQVEKRLLPQNLNLILKRIQHGQESWMLFTL